MWHLFGAVMSQNNKNAEDAPAGGPEKRIFEEVSKDNLQAVGEILRSGAVSVDITDEHGMTPLQHAAYRGNEAMCRMLLDLVSCHSRNSSQLSHS